MRKIIIIIIIITFSIQYFSFGQQWSRWRQWREPFEIFENVAKETNKDLQIQENALNDVSASEWWYPLQYKISNTLSSIRNNISPYLDWLVYIWTAISIILIIYNWLLLVFGQFSEEDHTKTIDKIKFIIIGVFILRWFWWILKIIMIIINALSWN